MNKKISLLSRNRLLNNISWIFFGNVGHSLLKFLLDAFVARILSLNDNGMLTYASSLISFVLVFCGFGFGSVITREFAEDEENAGRILGTCILTQAAAGAVAIGVIQVIIRIIAPNEPELYPIVFLQSISSLWSGTGLLVYWFRYRNQAKPVAIMRLVAFVIAAIIRVVVLLLTQNLIIYLISTLAESVFFGFFLVRFFLKTYKGSLRYSFFRLKRILRYSYPFITSALLQLIYAQTDKIMLKSMMSNEAVALYSAAAHLAGAISMIPSTLIEGFRPEVMEMKIKNEALCQKRFRQLYAVIFWSSIAYCLFVTFFDKYIILVMYGEKYLEATGALSLVVWYSAFSYFGSINNMYMVAEYKAKWVQITTLAGAVCNVVLNYLLIPAWGIMGAAMASLLTQFVANFLIMWIVKDLRPGFYNMIRGICLRDIR